MIELIKRLRNDQEVQELKKRCHELTGKWPPYDWEHYWDIDEYKEITAYSLEYEMTQKYLEDFVINMGTEKSIDGVQLYNTDDTSKSLIHLVLEKMPGWKPGHIDESLIKLQRSFDL